MSADVFKNPLLTQDQAIEIELALTARIEELQRRSKTVVAHSLTWEVLALDIKECEGALLVIQKAEVLS